ncbi:MAG TPA: hypothetical protein VMS17_26695 [Gemmataceae bacterium]|nr:hypothetical protein [Gemmataceae bacterium]
MTRQPSMRWMTACMMAVACAGLARADDPFRPRSVWINDDKGLTLKVIERDGRSFRARFTIGDGIERVVSGTVKNGRVDWLSDDVEAVRGGAGGDNHGVIVDDDTIMFVWIDGDGKNGSFTLHRR